VCQLRHLDTLELSENYLEQLPVAVGNLKKLTYLGLEHNRLKSLPDELCRVGSLVTLALGSNQLTGLPENIYQLTGLRELMLENNRLTELPLLMDRLVGLLETQGLWLHGNALRTPPQEICDQGVGPLFHFLKEVRVSEARHRRKMILIGAVKAGKTSLRNALMLGYSQLTEEHERTWVLERHLWEPESRLRVQVLDFGGHHIYQAAHHMFLTPEALHLLVFDLSRYTPQLYHELMGNWLDAIMDRAPGASILLVGTHADLCTADEVVERCEDAVRRMQKEEGAKIRELKEEIRRTRILLEQPEMAESGGASGRFKDISYERLQEKLSYLEKMLNTRSQIPDTVLVVSCAEGLSGMDTLKETVLESLKGAEDRKLPQSWFRFLSNLQSRTERILSIQQSLEIFVEVMESFHESLMGMAGSADRSLQMVLKYLHATGEIVWFHENERLNNIVFHRPETLIEMLRAVFRHDFEEVVNYDAELGQIVGLSVHRFELLKADFIRKGTMTYELLHFSLLHFQLSPDTLDTFISLMLKFDLCYETEGDRDPTLASSKRILQFPWFFPREQPDGVRTAWTEDIPPNTFEVRFEAHFPRKGPPYFFEKLSVRLQQYVTNRINWKHGVLAQLNHSTLLVVKERHEVPEDYTVVRAAARGATDLQVTLTLKVDSHLY
jgi:Leucine-rich repeat (LRR) protein